MGARLYIGNVLARYPARQPSLVYQMGDRHAFVIFPKRIEKLMIARLELQANKQSAAIRRARAPSPVYAHNTWADG